MRIAPALALIALAASHPALAQRNDIEKAVLVESKPPTPNVSTAELKAALARGTVVLDVRSAQEFALAHIPGAVNVYEKEVERIAAMVPDKRTELVLYCNGPHCKKSRRTAEALARLGYRKVRRYQLGLPVWRALGNTVQTDLDGVRYVLEKDRTAVFVDARAPEAFKAGSLPGAVNVRAGEAEAANDDGRLPHKDKSARVIVFAADPAEARKVASEIAQVAYWSSSYFGGTWDDLQKLLPPPASRKR